MLPRRRFLLAAALVGLSGLAGAHLPTNARSIPPLDAEGRPYTDDQITAGAILQIAPRLLDKVAREAAAELGTLQYRHLPRDFVTGTGTVTREVSLPAHDAPVSVPYAWSHSLRDSRLGGPVEELALAFRPGELLAGRVALGEGALRANFLTSYAVDGAALYALMAASDPALVEPVAGAVYRARPRNVSVPVEATETAWEFALLLETGEGWLTLPDFDSFQQRVAATAPPGLADHLAALGGAGAVMSLEGESNADEATRRMLAGTATIAADHVRAEVHRALTRAMAPISHAVADTTCRPGCGLWLHHQVDQIATVDDCLMICFNGLYAECAGNESVIAEFVTLDHQPREVAALGTPAAPWLAQYAIPQGNLKPVLVAAMLAWADSLRGVASTGSWRLETVRFSAAGAAGNLMAEVAMVSGDPTAGTGGRIAVSVEFALEQHAGGELLLVPRRGVVGEARIASAGPEWPSTIPDPSVGVSIPLGRFLDGASGWHPVLRLQDGYLVISLMEDGER